MALARYKWFVGCKNAHRADMLTLIAANTKLWPPAECSGFLSAKHRIGEASNAAIWWVSDGGLTRAQSDAILAHPAAQALISIGALIVVPARDKSADAVKAEKNMISEMEWQGKQA